MTTSSLLGVNDSVLIVIDIQPSFVKKESKDGNNSLLHRMCRVIKVANWLGVPLIITAEDISRTGNVSDEVAEILPRGTKAYQKSAVKPLALAMGIHRTCGGCRCQARS